MKINNLSKKGNFASASKTSGLIGTITRNARRAFAKLPFACHCCEEESYPADDFKAVGDDFACGQDRLGCLRVDAAHGPEVGVFCFAEVHDTSEVRNEWSAFDTISNSGAAGRFFHV